MKRTGVCISTAALLLFCGCSKEVKKNSERATRVEVSKPKQRLFRQTIPVQGTVTPLEHAVISAKISGTLDSMRIFCWAVVVYLTIVTILIVVLLLRLRVLYSKLMKAIQGLPSNK